MGSRKATENFLAGLDAAGHGIELSSKTILALPQFWRRRSDFLDQLYLSTVRILHVVILVGAFAGMILSLQTGLALSEFGQESRVGTIVAAAMAREMGPFITSVILAAAVGSAVAAELGTMTVSEEITALEVMSIDHVPYLVLPRVLALTIACPILTIFSNFVGIVGGGFVASSLVNVDMVLYSETVYETLRPAQGWVIPKDIYTGLIKAVVFGFLIGILSCSSGLRAEGGAMGVGAAARRAVRNSIILILVVGYIITRILYS